jgi:hypothetical protein
MIANIEPLRRTAKRLERYAIRVREKTLARQQP